MTKKKILADHKQKGKKFIPQMMQHYFLEEVNWINDFVPELMWIALVQGKLGHKEANEVILELHEIYLQVSESTSVMAFFSSYASLTESQKLLFIDKFKACNSYDRLLKGIKDLQYFYPQHPLEFLHDDLNIAKNEVDLEFIKSTLDGLNYRRSKEATYAQALVVYVAMATGKLKVTEGNTLLKINEINQYPDTETSRRVASSIRASINSLMGIHGQKNKCEWVNNFWAKSFQLEPPYISL